MASPAATTCGTCRKPLSATTGDCPSCGGATDIALAATALAPGPSPTRAETPRKPGPKPVREDDLVGAVVLGQYVVEKKLGEGGMGAVYLCDQPAIERKAVIKVLRQELSHSRDSATRFDVEAKAASQLNHPNI